MYGSMCKPFEDCNLFNSETIREGFTTEREVLGSVPSVGYIKDPKREI